MSVMTIKCDIRWFSKIVLRKSIILVFMRTDVCSADKGGIFKLDCVPFFSRFLDTGAPMMFVQELLCNVDQTRDSVVSRDCYF